MSSPAWSKLWQMKSLYIGVAAAMLAVLSVSFLLFRAISQRVQNSTITPIFDRFDELQLESAREILDTEGKKGLADYIANLDRIFGHGHYLLNAHGVDILTGEDRTELLPPTPAVKSRMQKRGHWVITHRSNDGMYWFAAEGQAGPPHVWAFLPYYFLVIGATGVLCWLAAIAVLSPVRKIASTIALFGQGDLSARAESERHDEIGQLARSFNQMAERLQRLIVSERRLLGDISHELRSPLARLKFAIKLARTSPDSKSALDRIERDVDRISSLVADIVAITFVEGDPALRGAETVVVADIVSDVLRDCVVEAQFRDCKVEVTGHVWGKVLGNRELLRRAVENVVRNAIRYSPENTTIHLFLSENERETIIVVRDFGPGVPDEALLRIFDPFFRVEEARDTNSGGTGLGLSIAKRAVQVHHGVITAENASPGLRVRIAIPLVSSLTTQ
jgi:signal transduction histidine kinase